MTCVTNNKREYGLQNLKRPSQLIFNAELKSYVQFWFINSCPTNELMTNHLKFETI